MARVFLIGEEIDSDKNISLFYEISYRLQSYGHEIIHLDRDFKQASRAEFQDSLTSAEVIIPVITKTLILSSNTHDLLIQAQNYSLANKNKFWLPVIENNVLDSTLAKLFRYPKSLTVDNKFDKAELDLLSGEINKLINSFIGEKIAKEEKAKEIQDRIEKTAESYITETIGELKKSERRQRYTALVWYILGFIALISGVGVVVFFSNLLTNNFNEDLNWIQIIYYSLRSILIILLLIASSKYSFTLAKSYMTESLKIADRIHAISFGRFYLQVFEQQINPNEIKEIFRDWNINNQNTNFSSQSVTDYDPKLIEKIIKLINTIKK